MQSMLESTFGWPKSDGMSSALFLNVCTVLTSISLSALCSNVQYVQYLPAAVRCFDVCEALMNIEYSMESSYSMVDRTHQGY